MCIRDRYTDDEEDVVTQAIIGGADAPSEIYLDSTVESEYGVYMAKAVRLDKFLADAGKGNSSEVKKIIQKGQALSLIHI